MMGSFERKMKRNALKDGHKQLKKQWKRENERRAAGVYVPVEPSPSSGLTNESPKDPGTIVVPTVPSYQSQRLPLLGRPPTLGQYKKVVEKAIAERAETIIKQKQEASAKRLEEEKKLAEEGWKEE